MTIRRDWSVAGGGWIAALRAPSPSMAAMVRPMMRRGVAQMVATWLAAAMASVAMIQRPLIGSARS
jgi:hypothetical protein